MFCWHFGRAGGEGEIGGACGTAFWACVVVCRVERVFRLSMSIYSKSRWALVMLDWEGSAGGVGESHVTGIIFCEQEMRLHIHNKQT